MREKLLPVVARLRGIADTRMGVRPFALYVRRSTPDDGRGGRGASWSVVDTLVAERPRVRGVNARDLVTSAGRVQVGDLKLDRITPRNEADTIGTAAEDLDIKPTAPGEKVCFVLAGPGLPEYVPADLEADPPTGPSGGAEFTAVHVDTTGNFEFSLVLRPATGRQ